MRGMKIGAPEENFEFGEVSQARTHGSANTLIISTTGRIHEMKISV
jgi:hypothetical protein